MDKRKYSGTELIISLLFLTIFISKGLFNILSGILLLYTIFKFIRKREISNNKVLAIYAIIPFFGVLFNFIYCGIGSVKDYLNNERGMLFSLVFFMLNLSLVEYERTKNWILVGGIVSAIYSGISFVTPKFLGIKTSYDTYKQTNKMTSFQNPIRWARLLQIIVPYSYINLEWVKKRIYKLFFVLLSVYFIWNIAINGQRAAILGAFISMSIFFLMYIFSLKKNRITYVFVVGMVTLALGYGLVHSDKMIEKRVISIFDLNENISNRVRLDYWKTGTDILKENKYMGIGSGNSKKFFEEFISKKNVDYVKKYYKYQEGTPFENNYLNMAVENGLLYLIYFIFAQVLVLIEIFKAYLRVNCKDKKIKLMIIFSLIIGDRIFMFFYPGTDTYVEFLITFLMFYAFKLKESEKIDE